MHYSWIEPQVLAAGATPLDAADVRVLHADGIRAILTLTESPLFRFDDISSDLFNELDIQYFHIPFADQHPPTHSQADEIIALLAAMHVQQRPLFVHCFGGSGRTGTVLHLHLLAQGFPWDAVRARIKATRWQCLRITDEQRDFLQQRNLA